MNSDSIYSKQFENVSDFKFDESVANVFPDMIKRSVPGYTSITAMTGMLAAEYAREKSYCYDLGCSLGAASLSMANSINKPDCKIIAVDNSYEMIKKCKQLGEQANCTIPINHLCADISDIKIENASIIVMNFTLQFIKKEKKSALLQKIYNGLLPGGIFILSEKLKFTDLAQQDLLTDLHHIFKRANGYSSLEISQKRTALENVLKSDTVDQHRKRLQQVGFAQAQLWFQCFNFASIVALK